MTARARKAKPPAPARPPAPLAPCELVGCAGHLVAVDRAGAPIDRERGDAHHWRCSVEICSFATAPEWDDEKGCKIAGAVERCPTDGSILVFAAAVTGKTCGGLMLRGWNHCPLCDGYWLTRRGVPHHGGDDEGRWKVASSGRSLDVGGIRLRAEGGRGNKSGNVAGLMQRIARLPGLEAALLAIANGDDAMTGQTMRELALAALAIDGPGDETEGGDGDSSDGADGVDAAGEG